MKSLLNQIARPALGTCIAKKVALGEKPVWFAASCIDGHVRLAVQIECVDGIGQNRALLQFNFCDDTLNPAAIGVSKSHREEIGYYAYLKTSPGVASQTIDLTVPGSRKQILVGVRAWYNESAVSLLRLDDLNRLEVRYGPGDTKILFSVDVEALPGRAPDNHIKHLIWGGQGPEGHGIGRLTELFNQHGVKATFYVDFASSCLHGDDGLADAARYLDANGQDVQLHVHSEVLIRNQHWAHDSDHIPTFAIHSFSAAKRAIGYSASKYEKALGRRPDIFRAGGLWWATDSVFATLAAGVPGASNVSPTRPLCPSSNVFRWENGLFELPVDFCLDSYIKNGCGSLLSDVETILANKTDRLVSCYLHSWSLSPRTSDGFHLEYSEKYQRNLEEAIRILKSVGDASVSNTSYLFDRAQRRMATIPLTWCDEQLNVKNELPEAPSDRCVCNICGTYLVKAKLKNDVCPYCRLRTRHRILKSVLDRQSGDVFAGKRLLANHADPNEIDAFFGDASEIVNFDVRPLDYLDCVADVQDLAQFGDGSFDIFYSVYVLNHVRDDRKALGEMCRVLADNGVAVIMVPFRFNQPTQLHTDLTQNYGQEALDKHGVGSYRYYGFDDLRRILEINFDVEYHLAVDPFSGAQDAVFLCRKHLTRGGVGGGAV